MLTRLRINLLEVEHHASFAKLTISIIQQAARGRQPGPPSHLVRPLPTLWFFPVMHENPNPTVYVKKLIFLCGAPRCLKLVIWPTDKKMWHTPAIDPLIFHFTKYKCTWLTAVSKSLSRCITCQDVCVPQLMQQNVCYHNIKRTLQVCCHVIAT